MGQRGGESRKEAEQYGEEVYSVGGRRGEAEDIGRMYSRSKEWEVCLDLEECSEVVKQME